MGGVDSGRRNRNDFGAVDQLAHVIAKNRHFGHGLLEGRNHKGMVSYEWACQKKLRRNDYRALEHSLMKDCHWQAVRLSLLRCVFVDQRPGVSSQTIRKHTERVPSRTASGTLQEEETRPLRRWDRRQGKAHPEAVSMKDITMTR